MRFTFARSVARGSLIAAALLGTGVFSGTALSSSAATTPDRQARLGPAPDFSTLPKIKQYLRSLGVDPRGVVIQRGAKNYAGPHCPGPAWNCTTARKVVQLSSRAAAADDDDDENRFVCRRNRGSGTQTPDATPPEQSCVIVQGANSINSATCDIETRTSTGPISQTCLITQGGASNTAVARLEAVLRSQGTEQDVVQRIEIKQTGGAVGNNLTATEIARLSVGGGGDGDDDDDDDEGGGGTGGANVLTKQDFHQVICGNQQAAGNGNNGARVTQQGVTTADHENAGDVEILQNTEPLASTCLPTGPAAPFADISVQGHNDTLCPVETDSFGSAKADANTCARIQQDSGSGRNSVLQRQTSRLDAEVDGAGNVEIEQGSAQGGIDSTQDQESTGISQIVDTQDADQLVSVEGEDSVNVTQIEDPRCCAAGHQLGNAGNTWSLGQDLTQRVLVDGVLVDPQDEGSDTEQIGANYGNCTSSGTCTVEQRTQQQGTTETNSCSGSDCDIFTACTAGECATEDDVVISNTATADSTTTDPDSSNNSDTETTLVTGASPALSAFSRSTRVTGTPRGTGPADQTPSPPPAVDPLDPIIDNGSLVQLGINPEGHLNVCCGSASFESGTTVVGVRYIPTDGEATAPGCLCEGWGVANADEATGTFSGYANISSDGGAVGLTVDTANTGLYGADSSIDDDSVGTNFRSVTTAGGRVKVTQDYHPSTSSNLYEVLVTMENIGAAPMGDVRYRRVMDWDIPPTTFSEWSEIHVGTSSALVRATSDGFMSANPLNMSEPSAGAPPTTLHSGDSDYFAGPDDQGSSFDFTFGSLAPGQQKTFRIFYGAAANRTSALSAIASVGGEIYSLGMPNNPTADPPAAATDGPNVFIFAFAGVGGQPVGNISLAPLTSENEVGENHTVTATLDDDGTPIAGKVVTFTVVSGPNIGVTGTDTSDANGEATFTYTSSLTGTDQIEARFVDDAANTHTSNRVEKTWTPATATSADLSVSMSDSPDPVQEGEELTYTIVVSNNGPDAAQNVTLTDTLPETVTFNSATATQGDCSGTETVVCDLGTIASSASATVTIKVTA